MNNFAILLERGKPIVDIIFSTDPDWTRDIHGASIKTPDGELKVTFLRGHTFSFHSTLISKEEWHNYERALHRLHVKNKLQLTPGVILPKHRDMQKALDIFNKVTTQGHLGI